jgi:hypothetical protein
MLQLQMRHQSRQTRVPSTLPRLLHCLSQRLMNRKQSRLLQGRSRPLLLLLLLGPQSC